MSSERTSERRRILEAFGALPEDVESLLAYNHPTFLQEQASVLRFPLADEPFVAPWKEYAAAVAHAGTLTTLFPYLTELVPPAGTQAAAADATRAVNGQDLQNSASGRVILNRTVAGTLPAIVAGTHDDFVVLVQAIARRGVAVNLPASMGALFLGNYKNKYRHRQWLAAHPEAKGGANAVPTHEYIDRFAILGPGPYSGIAPSQRSLPAEDWNRQSLQIRLEHECTHYFTRRVFGAVRINVLDELLADFSALRKVYGRFDPDLQRLFLGLEGDSEYRSGGRLENYFPATLSSQARSTLEKLVRLAIQGLAAFDSLHPIAVESPEDEAAVLIAIACSSLEELAAPDAADNLLAFVSRWLTRRGLTACPPRKN